MATAPERDRAGPERQPWRRAAIRAAVLKGAALPIPPPFRKGATVPELGAAMAAVLECPGAELEPHRWRRAAIRAAVLKGAALPIPPPFREGATLPELGAAMAAALECRRAELEL